MPNLNLMRTGSKGTNKTSLRNNGQKYAQQQAQRQREYESRQARRAELLKRKKQLNIEAE